MPLQSNSTLASPEVLDQLNLQTTDVEYTLSTLTSPKSIRSGRFTKSIRISGVYDDAIFDIVNITECTEIPDASLELGTQSDCSAWPHLSSIQPSLPTEEDRDLKTLLLIGREASDVIKVYEIKNGNSFYQPYAHRIGLGWTLLGPICCDQSPSS